jgi:hypothetical protein
MSDKIEQYPGITPDHFVRICADIKAKTGIEIDKDAGEASAKGITISWKYDRTTQGLTIQTLKRSWFDPSEDTIDNDISIEIENTK